MEFGRLITAMVTPFNEQGEIHWEETASLIDYLIVEQKSESLVVSGTTGESPTLSDTEKVQLFEFAVKHAGGRCKIIAGTGSNNTAHSIHLTQEAEVPEWMAFCWLFRITTNLAKKVCLDILKRLQAPPSCQLCSTMCQERTVTSLSAETTLRLAQIPNIVATKECASMEQVTLIAASAPENFRVYSGDDSSGLPAIAVGAYGIVSVASHVVGAEMKKMIDAFYGGAPLQAAQIHQQLFPVFKGLFECPQPLPNPVAVKYALTLRGLDVGSVRLPLIPPTEEEQVYIKGLLNL